jgi:hypothetical protein
MSAVDDWQQREHAAREHAAALRAVVLWRWWREGHIRFLVVQAAMDELRAELAEEETAPDPSSADG